MIEKLEIRSLREFDAALQELFEEKGGLNVYNYSCFSFSAFYNDPEKKHRDSLEFREDFCKRYGFSEELFDLSLKASVGKQFVDFIEGILKDRNYRIST